MAEFIELRRLYKTYGTVVKTNALQDVSLVFKKGEMAAVIGQSGSGKSTLLNMMGVLDRPDSGEIVFEERNLYALPDKELAHFRSIHLGFVFQFHHLLPEFTALENVLIPYRLAHGRAGADAVSRARQLLDRVGVSGRLNNRAVNLSGGQQQRVAIARALMNRPEIILADEPTGNLDSDSGESVLNLMREINRQESVTFVVVTHDRHIAAACDRVIEMADGRVISDLALQGVSPDETWNRLSPCFCRLRQSAGKA